MLNGLNGMHEPDMDERHILVIITGGTICMQNSPDGLVPTRDFVSNCLSPSPDFNDGSLYENTTVTDEHGDEGTAQTLRAPPRTPGALRYKYSVFEFAELIDSSSMDGNQWRLIIECLARNWDSFDAFVILHGTDTLAYTASALAFMLGPLDKTVIVTGSQLSMYASNNDAHDNLLDSLTVAARFDVPEVGVVFHHNLYRATRVTKVSAFSVAAFTTPNAKPLASFTRNMDENWVAEIYLSTIKPAVEKPIKPSSEATLSSIEPTTFLDTSRVAVLKVYPGISANLIKSIIQMPTLGGLILETFGAGNIPLGTGDKSLLEILSKAVEMGIVVVSVTQCLTGSVTSAYESARRMERRGIVTGLDMTTEAAYTKLAYLLSLPDLDNAEISRMMRHNLRGELTADSREEQRTRDSAAALSPTQSRSQ